MALQWKDRVAEISTTTGTGAFTLAGALTSYRAFSAVCSVNDTVYYVITAVDGNGNPTGEWETGLGTYSASNTLTRTTVLDSSNSGSVVNFGAGTKRVVLSQVAAVAKQATSNGPTWTPLTFGSSSTNYAQTVYNANETFALAVGQRIEVEAYIYKVIDTDAGVWIGDLTDGHNARLQLDNNCVLYRRSSSTDTPIGAPGSNTYRDYTGIFTIRFVINCHANSGAQRNYLHGVFNDTMQIQTSNSGAFSTDTTHTISIQTGDIAKCSARARVLG